MAYLLDANVFITAKNTYYGFDFCRAFWDWIDLAHAAGVVYSVERVYDELLERDDELTAWCRGRGDMFLSLTADDVRAVATVNRWSINSRDYDPAAKSEFADAADSFLVAQAMAGSHTVVTHERISDGRRRIKIPMPPQRTVSRGARLSTCSVSSKRGSFSMGSRDVGIKLGADGAEAVELPQRAARQRGVADRVRRATP